MMGALASWLKELIVIILIATFVELLLPGKSMLRYVRTVIGLFIILTILTPIIRFLTSDFDPERVLQAAMNLPGEQTEITSLHNVLREGNRLREQQEKKALDMLQQQLETIIAGEMEDRFPLRVLNIRAEIGVNEDELPDLRRIGATVSWLQTEAVEAVNTEAGDRAVQVEAIIIEDVAIGPILESDITEQPPSSSVQSGTNGQEKEPAASVEGEYTVDDLVDWLSTRWDVERRSIDIQVLDSTRN